MSITQAICTTVMEEKLPHEHGARINHAGTLLFHAFFTPTANVLRKCIMARSCSSTESFTPEILVEFRFNFIWICGTITHFRTTTANQNCNK
jgi:hypothetical protein